MIEIVNRQRHRKLDSKTWREFASQALLAIGKDDRSATIAFVSNRQMLDLNRRFRGIPKSTDVLSFPSEADGFSENPDLGDVVVAVEQAEAQARENGLSFDMEVSQLILHGLLHLCGYDHETDKGEMNRLELRLRKKLNI